MQKAQAAGKYHVYVFEGGSRSGKTYGIIDFFLLYALQNPTLQTRIAIARKKATWLYATLWVDFVNILNATGIASFCKVNNTLHTVQLFSTTFTFVGLDDAQKLHGLTTDIVWINEAMEATKNDFDQLEQRTSRFSVLDYNPSAEEHWIYSTVCTRPDCYFDHSTMMGNPFLPENSRRKILSYEPTEENYANGTADERKWKIYGLGLRAKLEGLIFPEYQLIDKIPERIDKRWYGLDLGFSNDPTAIVELGYWNNTLYMKEHCYETGMQSKDIIARLRALQAVRRLKIISESADPRLVKEMQQAGLPVFPVHKYAGSIEAGLDFMHGCRHFITSDSPNLKAEWDAYTYQQAPDGHFLNIPASGQADHLADAARYICLEELIGKNGKPVDLDKVARAIGRGGRPTPVFDPSAR